VKDLVRHLVASRLVKGWTKSGQSFEKVFDVVWASDRKPARGDGHGAADRRTVDVENATYTEHDRRGRAQTVWTDPEFDPSLLASTTPRVLEIPTPRWTTIQAKQLGVPPPDVVAASVQEAWHGSLTHLVHASAGLARTQPGHHRGPDLKKKGRGPERRRSSGH